MALAPLLTGADDTRLQESAAHKAFSLIRALFGQRLR
jgi:hypothetical protein